MSEINVAENEVLSKVRQKAAKQPKVALRILRREKLNTPDRELAIQSYELNRRRSGEEAARETMLTYLR